MWTVALALEFLLFILGYWVLKIPRRLVPYACSESNGQVEYWGCHFAIHSIYVGIVGLLIAIQISLRLLSKSKTKKATQRNRCASTIPGRLRPHR